MSRVEGGAEPCGPLVNHELVPVPCSGRVRVEERPVVRPDGRTVAKLHTVWIWMENPEQLNSYTTEMVKELILAFRRASMDRAAVAVVLTAVGTRAFCSGGNTREYAEYYAGRPLEYRQYLRLFNDLVTSILTCDRPVINRVNGMRVAGGQEIGMACDFSLSSDLAVFGQAGPKHGSAPDGGSTDFLPLFVGIERAMQSCTLCEMWSAHKALQAGLLSGIVPVCRLEKKWIPNPLVETVRLVDEAGRPCLGRFKEGDARAEGLQLLDRASVDLTLLDESVAALVGKLLMTMPECLTRTVESVRRHKLAHWDRNREGNRAWLALNMATEGKAGFRAFQQGTRGNREVDFIRLRQSLARGRGWDAALEQEIRPSSELSGETPRVRGED